MVQVYGKRYSIVGVAVRGRSAVRVSEAAVAVPTAAVLYWLCLRLCSLPLLLLLLWAVGAACPTWPWRRRRLRG